MIVSSVLLPWEVRNRESRSTPCLKAQRLQIDSTHALESTRVPSISKRIASQLRLIKGSSPFGDILERATCVRTILNERASVWPAMLGSCALSYLGLRRTASAVPRDDPISWLPHSRHSPPIIGRPGPQSQSRHIDRRVSGTTHKSSNAPLIQVGRPQPASWPVPEHKVP